MERVFSILYTHQKTKKAKTWQDGTLKVCTAQNRAILYDDKKSKLDALYIRQDQVCPGAELESDRYLIQVEEPLTNGPAADPANAPRHALPSHPARPAPARRGGLPLRQPRYPDAAARQEQPPAGATSTLSSGQGGGVKRKRGVAGFIPPRQLKVHRTDPAPQVNDPPPMTALQVLQANKSRLTSARSSETFLQGGSPRDAARPTLFNMYSGKHEATRENTPPKPQDQPRTAVEPNLGISDGNSEFGFQMNSRDHTCDDNSPSSSRPWVVVVEAATPTQNNTIVDPCEKEEMRWNEEQKSDISLEQWQVKQDAHARDSADNHMESQDIEWQRDNQYYDTSRNNPAQNQTLPRAQPNSNLSNADDLLLSQGARGSLRVYDRVLSTMRSADGPSPWSIIGKKKNVNRNQSPTPAIQTMDVCHGSTVQSRAKPDVYNKIAPPQLSSDPPDNRMVSSASTSIGSSSGSANDAYDRSSEVSLHGAKRKPWEILALLGSGAGGKESTTVGESSICMGSTENSVTNPDDETKLTEESMNDEGGTLIVSNYEKYDENLDTSLEGYPENDKEELHIHGGSQTSNANKDDDDNGSPGSALPDSDSDNITEPPTENTCLDQDPNLTSGGSTRNQGGTEDCKSRTLSDEAQPCFEISFSPLSHAWYSDGEDDSLCPASGESCPSQISHHEPPQEKLREQISNSSLGNGEGVTSKTDTPAERFQGGNQEELLQLVEDEPRLTPTDVDEESHPENQLVQEKVAAKGAARVQDHSHPDQVKAVLSKENMHGAPLGNATSSSNTSFTAPGDQTTTTSISPNTNPPSTTPSTTSISATTRNIPTMSTALINSVSSGGDNDPTCQPMDQIINTEDMEGKVNVRDSVRGEAEERGGVREQEEEEEEQVVVSRKDESGGEKDSMVRVEGKEGTDDRINKGLRINIEEMNKQESCRERGQGEEKDAVTAAQEVVVSRKDEEKEEQRVAYVRMDKGRNDSEMEVRELGVEEGGLQGEMDGMDWDDLEWESEQHPEVGTYREGGEKLRKKVNPEVHENECGAEGEKKLRKKANLEVDENECGAEGEKELRKKANLEMDENEEEVGFSHSTGLHRGVSNDVAVSDMGGNANSGGCESKEDVHGMDLVKGRDFGGVGNEKKNVRGKEPSRGGSHRLEGKEIDVKEREITGDNVSREEPKEGKMERNEFPYEHMREKEAEGQQHDREEYTAEPEVSVGGFGSWEFNGEDLRGWSGGEEVGMDMAGQERTAPEGAAVRAGIGEGLQRRAVADGEHGSSQRPARNRLQWGDSGTNTARQEANPTAQPPIHPDCDSGAAPAPAPARPMSPHAAQPQPLEQTLINRAPVNGQKGGRTVAASSAFVRSSTMTAPDNSPGDGHPTAHGQRLTDTGAVNKAQMASKRGPQSGSEPSDIGSKPWGQGPVGNFINIEGPCVSQAVNISGNKRLMKESESMQTSLIAPSESSEPCQKQSKNRLSLNKSSIMVDKSCSKNPERIVIGERAVHYTQSPTLPKDTALGPTGGFEKVKVKQNGSVNNDSPVLSNHARLQLNDLEFSPEIPFTYSSGQCPSVQSEQRQGVSGPCRLTQEEAEHSLNETLIVRSPQTPVPTLPPRPQHGAAVRKDAEDGIVDNTEIGCNDSSQPDLTISQIDVKISQTVVPSSEPNLETVSVLGGTSQTSTYNSPTAQLVTSMTESITWRKPSSADHHVDRSQFSANVLSHSQSSDQSEFSADFTTNPEPRHKWVTPSPDDIPENIRLHYSHKLAPDDHRASMSPKPTTPVDSHDMYGDMRQRFEMPHLTRDCRKPPSFGPFRDLDPLGVTLKESMTLDIYKRDSNCSTAQTMPHMTSHPVSMSCMTSPMTSETVSLKMSHPTSWLSRDIPNTNNEALGATTNLHRGPARVPRLPSLGRPSLPPAGRVSLPPGAVFQLSGSQRPVTACTQGVRRDKPPLPDTVSARLEAYTVKGAVVSDRVRRQDTTAARPCEPPPTAVHHTPIQHGYTGLAVDDLSLYDFEDPNLLKPPVEETPFVFSPVQVQTNYGVSPSQEVPGECLEPWLVTRPTLPLDVSPPEHPGLPLTPDIQSTMVAKSQNEVPDRDWPINDGSIKHGGHSVVGCSQREIRAAGGDVRPPKRQPLRCQPTDDPVVYTSYNTCIGTDKSELRSADPPESHLGHCERPQSFDVSEPTTSSTRPTHGVRAVCGSPRVTGHMFRSSPGQVVPADPSPKRSPAESPRPLWLLPDSPGGLSFLDSPLPSSSHSRTSRLTLQQPITQTNNNNNYSAAAPQSLRSAAYQPALNQQGATNNARTTALRRATAGFLERPQWPKSPLKESVIYDRQPEPLADEWRSTQESHSEVVSDLGLTPEQDNLMPYTTDGASKWDAFREEDEMKTSMTHYHSRFSQPAPAPWEAASANRVEAVSRVSYLEDEWQQDFFGESDFPVPNKTGPETHQSRFYHQEQAMNRTGPKTHQKGFQHQEPPLNRKGLETQTRFDNYQEPAQRKQTGAYSRIPYPEDDRWQQEFLGDTSFSDADFKEPNPQTTPVLAETVTPLTSATSNRNLKGQMTPMTLTPSNGNLQGQMTPMTSATSNGNLQGQMTPMTLTPSNGNLQGQMTPMTSATSNGNLQGQMTPMTLTPSNGNLQGEMTPMTLTPSNGNLQGRATPNLSLQPVDSTYSPELFSQYEDEDTPVDRPSSLPHAHPQSCSHSQHRSSSPYNSAGGATSTSRSVVPVGTSRGRHRGFRPPRPVGGSTVGEGPGGSTSVGEGGTGQSRYTCSSSSSRPPVSSPWCTPTLPHSSTQPGGLQGELRFPAHEDVETTVTPQRQAVIPASFPNANLYRQALTNAIREHLNVLLFELSRRYHAALARVDTTDYDPGSGGGGTSTGAGTSTNPVCKHGAPTKMVQVRKQGANQGRFFYTCAGERNQQCGFFKWVEDASSSKTGTPSSGTGQASTLKISDGASLTSFIRGSGINFYCECQLLRKDKQNMPTWMRKKMGMDDESVQKKLFVKLPRKEASSSYGKDDIWVLSSQLDFNPAHTIIVRSTFYGPNQAMELEIQPIGRYSPSNWPNGAFCHGIHMGNASSELGCMSNVEETLLPSTLPILPHLLNRSDSVNADGSSRGFSAPKMHEKKVFFVPGEIVDEIAAEMVDKYRLNQDQAAALLRIAAMFASARTQPRPPITLIHGVFGAGKSYLLAVVVLFLSRLFTENDVFTPDVPDPLKVLISSTTNVAVDRILLGLLELGHDDFVRVGSVKKIAKPILPYSVHATGSDTKELKDLQEMMKSQELTPTEKIHVRRSIEQYRKGANKKRLKSVRIVGVTCAACVFKCLQEFKFPVVLLDECSQMTEPMSLLPVAKFGCHKLVLVGDPKQLDPTIQGSEPSHNHGLEQTLFDRLLLMGHDAVMLRTQYRCHPLISAIPNKLFYNRQLCDGITSADRPPLLAGWPSLSFLDVRDGCEKGMTSGSFYNDQEAELIVALIDRLTRAGVEPASIGVITLYKGQQARTAQLLSDANSEMNGVQVSTVDAFQGGERDVIFLSCVRTHYVGFIDSDKRTNVALSRAKHHLFIVGHRKNLTNNPLWRKVIKHCLESPRGMQIGTDFLNSLEMSSTSGGGQSQRWLDSLSAPPDVGLGGGSTATTGCVHGETTEHPSPSPPMDMSPDNDFTVASETRRSRRQKKVHDISLSAFDDPRGGHLSDSDDDLPTYL